MKFLTYIESTGTQYINTGLNGKSGLKFEGEVAFTEITSSDPVLIGSYSPRSYAVIVQNQVFSYAYIDLINSSKTVQANTAYKFISDLSLNNQSLTINNEVVATSKNTTALNNSYPMYIFANNVLGSTNNRCKAKLYYLKIYDNGTLIRDFVPAENDDGAIGMYDKVNEVFYSNAGTGSFIAGEEISLAPKLSHTFSRLLNNVIYYGKVFVVNPKGRINLRCDLASAFATPVGGIKLETLPVGSEVKIPVSGVDCNFIVVNQGNPDSALYDSSCDGTWLLMKDVYEKRAWDSANNDYANSDVHAYLNGTFLGLLDSDVQSIIKQVKIPYIKGSKSSSLASGSNGLSTKVFLLAANETGATSSDFVALADEGAKLSYFESGTGDTANSKRIAYYNGTATRWWFRTPYSATADNVNAVDTNGKPNGGSLCTYAEMGIRPALILPSDTECELTPNADGSYNLNLVPPFPEEPTAYELIKTVTASKIFTAPEDGYYQIELFGRSGKGGAGSYALGGKITSSGVAYYQAASYAAGGGGGGGAYCCSRVKLNKGDTIAVTISTTCEVTITASTGESYSVMKCTTGSDGGAASTPSYSSKSTGGTGGSGGTASGGNYANKNGNAGSKGSAMKINGGDPYPSTVSGAGGTAVVSGGNAGGKGGKISYSIKTIAHDEGDHYRLYNVRLGSGGSAKAGFAKIYRGNTNIVS